MHAQSSQSVTIPNRSMPPGTIIPELVYGDLATAVAWLCTTFGFKSGSASATIVPVRISSGVRDRGRAVWRAGGRLS
jgi:hypothetical protein